MDGGGEVFGLGGVVPDGRMFLFPYAAQRGALIDPVARTLVQIEPSFVYSPGTGTTTVVPVTPEAPGWGDWAGGLLAPNGKIYGIPARAERVLEIDTKALGTLPLEVLLNGFTNRY